MGPFRHPSQKSREVPMVPHHSLLDEASDPPGDIDWDLRVNCGEVQPVLYEAFEDYLLTRL